MKEQEELPSTEEEWKERLSPEQYRVLREEATEKPFTGEYYKHKEEGVYLCAGCGAELFSSETKYESGSGWPSYYAPVSDDRVGTKPDYKLGSKRTEVHCSRCGGHLGHIFQDGPEPTGLRYCVNSASLEFQRAEGNGRDS